MIGAVVIGGTGFIGRHVHDAFVAAGHPVTTIARTPDESSVVLDVARAPPAEIAEVLRAIRPAVVVNAAGGVWGVDEAQMTEANVTLVHRLVTALAMLDWRPRTVHLGSVYEYGSAPITETAHPPPTTHYARSKLSGTNAFLSAVSNGNVDGAVLRVSTVIGAGSPPDSLHGMVAAKLLATAGSGKKPVLRLHSLSAKRDYLDAWDLADAVVRVAGLPVRRVLNIGGGRTVSTRHMVRLLIEISGVPAEVVNTDPAAPPAHPDRRRVDITTAREVLGWAPRRSPADSLRALWEAAVRTEEVELT